MALAADLAPEHLRARLGERPLRVYPALLSTGADAQAWARAGAPHGAVVVAGYQASPRGRAGLEWRVRPERDLGCSVVVRPDLTAEDEGWLYVAASAALADVLGDDAVVRWPDEVRSAAGLRLGAIGVHAELGPGRVQWAVVSVLVEDVPALAPRGAASGAASGTGPASADRGVLLAALLDALDRRLAEPRAVVLDAYRPRCATLGAEVAARMIPMGSAGVVIEGTADDVGQDGALWLRNASSRRVAVRPQHLGLLDPAEPG
jgi:BirA family transcriptional regulator, biotin operon repressor / biotin---[acetyl-CoA-carboxylase] ligase